MYTETFGNYAFDFKNSRVNKDSYKDLINKSPLIDSVKTPVLFMFGSAYSRLPAIQGKEY